MKSDPPDGRDFAPPRSGCHTTTVEVPYEAIYDLGWKLKDHERRRAKAKGKA